MKKIMSAAILILVISIILIFTSYQLDKGQQGSKNQNLIVFNWGEYIDPSLIDKFEKETGIRVIYETFDSNEAMLAKIEQGGTAYDIAIPSDYMINKMKDQDLLIPLDKSKLTHFKDIDPQLLNKSFDSGNEYSVPYFWGTVGIIYHPDKINENLTFDSWNDLWDPSLKNNILLIDGAREMMGIALQSLGYSVNDNNPVNLSVAERKLETLAPNIKAINGDEKKMLMQNNEAPVAIVWSGDAADIISENEELTYKIPKEGTNLWFDNMVIPKTSQNQEAAYKFINFIMSPENYAQNAEYIGYSTPSLAAKALLPEEIREDERFYPDLSSLKKSEVYDNLPRDILQKYNDLFLEFKMNSR